MVTASLGLLNDLLLGVLLIHGRRIVLWKFGIHLLLVQTFETLHILIILVESDTFVWGPATNLGHDDGNETAQSHTDKVRKCSGEDTDEDGNNDRKESATEEHVHAMRVVVMMIMSMVAFLGLGAVVRAARSEPVGRLALGGTFGHRVALVLVAGLAHRRLHAADPIGNDALPLAQQRPFLALFGFLGSAGLGCVSGCERRNHETASCILEQVDGEGGRIDRDSFDRRDVEIHGEELHARLGDRFGGVIVERIASDTELEVLLSRGVYLCNEEGLCEVAEGWGV